MSLHWVYFNYYCLVISLISVQYVATDCASKVTNNNNAIHIRSVTSGFDLQRVANNNIAQLEVINGTHWIHLGGDVQEFGPVLGTPPATSSDVTLDAALQQLNQTRTGCLVRFHPPEFSNSVVNVLEKYAKDIPIWDYFPVDKGLDKPLLRQVLPAFEWSTKQYGLDNVFERVQREGVLLPFDYYRSKALLDKIFSRQKVTDSEVVYLRRKYKTVQKDYLNSFTELYMSNLVHLVDHLKNLAGKDQEVEFLPDLQLQNVVYTEADMQQVNTYIEDIDDNTCVIVVVRAGIFLPPESLANLDSLLTNHANVLLLVTALPHDPLPVQQLATAVNAIGTPRLILDLPSRILDQLERLGSVPKPDIVSLQAEAPSSSSSTLHRTCGSIIVVLVLVNYALSVFHHRDT